MTPPPATAGRLATFKRRDGASGKPREREREDEEAEDRRGVPPRDRPCSTRQSPTVLKLGTGQEVRSL